MIYFCVFKAKCTCTVHLVLWPALTQNIHFHVVIYRKAIIHQSPPGHASDARLYKLQHASSMCVRQRKKHLDHCEEEVSICSV